MRIAVAGGGISGMLVARMLADEHEVHLLEAEGPVGGHTHTVDVKVAGEIYAADTSAADAARMGVVLLLL